MNDMLITVFTQVYNTEAFLETCIQSVLSQTYKSFEYIIVDNGCTDGCTEMLRKFAAKDSRIKLIRYDENRHNFGVSLVKEIGKGEYVVWLDSDDWIEPDFLEHLVNLAVSTNSDIVTTGSVFHTEGTSYVYNREIRQRLTLEKKDYANSFPYYHVFFRAVWAKLIRMEIIKKTLHLSTNETGVSYGFDTIQGFAWLRKTERICIDNSILHHYRIHHKSVSHKYDPRQSFSDVYLFNDAVDFLSAYGPISTENMTFLHIVYANAIKDTSENIINSTLSAAEKLHEYRKILTRQLTKDAYKVNFKDVNNSKIHLLTAVLKCAGELDEENDDLNAILSAQLPNCGKAISASNVKLFVAEKSLFDPLLQDERDILVKNLLSLISRQMYVKQYKLGEMVCRLSYDKPLLSNITSTKFLRRHGDIYLMVWQEKYGDALVAMTEYLLSSNKIDDDFLQLYLSLAAVLECANEFIFGKIKSALYYFSEKRYDECRAAISDLSDMGVEDTPEIAKIKNQLGY